MAKFSSLRRVLSKGVSGTLLLLPLLALLAACGGVTTPTGNDVNKVETAVAKAPSKEKLVSLHMFNLTNGWATTDKAILHTNLGIAHWQTTTPKVYKGSNESEHSSSNQNEFYDTNHAWTARTEGDTAYVSRTFDGGAHWNDTSFHLDNVGGMTSVIDISFVDDQHGWLLVALGAGAGTQYVAVYRTENGGANWTLAASTFSSGHKLGLTFRDTKNGWATGENGAIYDRIFLYATHDGGSNWNAQAIDVPDTNVVYQSYAPTFFGDQDGILPVTWQKDEVRYLNVYVTHDGGDHWSKTSTVKSSSLPFFSDSSHGWYKGSDNKLYSTQDGGSNWSVVNDDAAAVKSLDFIDQNTGWATVDNNYLLTTPDAGQHWFQTPYVIE